MTVNEKIHEQSFCYDADMPPSVPAGMPLCPPAGGKSSPRKRRRRRLLSRRRSSR